MRKVGVTGKFIINNLLIGATGSVGILEMPHYIKRFRENIAENVYIMMSHSAKKFITPYTMRLYSGNYVFTDSFDITDDVKVPHIDLTRRCDVFVVMPATANIIGKAANGICDDLISTAIMACTSPIVFVPVMNPALWFNKATQRNISILKEFGHHVLSPSEGYEIADMKPSFGSMPEFDVIVNCIKDIVNKK